MRALCMSPHVDDVEYGMAGTILRTKTTQFDILEMIPANNARYREARLAWESVPNCNVIFSELNFAHGVQEREWIKYLEAPDLERIFESWFVRGDLSEQLAINYIFGGNKMPNKVYPDQHHLTGFTLSRLASVMSEAGFADIRRVEGKMHWALAVDARRDND